MFKRCIHTAVTAVVALSGGGALWAGEGEVATVQVGGTSIVFISQVPSEELALTVSGKGVHFTRDYGPGETPALSVGDDALLNGTYKYELRTVPKRDEAALLKADKAGDEDRLAELWRDYQQQVLVQSGSLKVVDGHFVEPKSE